ncbi:hypothetical protein BU17DRAFT_93039 [Hysterangium stoloniferum]|nr:hypothetical protein BU17DRAFT_93039 [Hysterangium stoloniferum]
MVSSSATVAAPCTTSPNSQQPTSPPTQPSVETVSDNDATKVAQHIQSRSSSMFQESTTQNASLARNIPINPSLPSSTPKQQSTSTATSQSTRTYNAHLPYNPSRPPPYTYQRQHEFPPFPPLAQHPVLPFLTTAFSSQQEPAPVAAPPPKARPNLAPRASTTQRHVQSTTSSIPTMDVSRNDPAAIFIRPPLVVPFPPNVESNITWNGTDGQPIPGTPLTYTILHAHRNWFLDADDFRKDNPRRIDYPPELEPPRGWAPLNECTGAGAASRCRQAKEAKEKEKDKDKGPTARTKGSYAQTETGSEAIECGPSDDCHEKTILRCTFCRREYHGPNAKSMWRRHVYDKHKVAMKNRREGSAGTAYKSVSKKGKPPKPPSPSPALGPALVLMPPAALDTPKLTLDLTKEQNLIRLLERVVAGNLNISLPSSVLGDGTTAINIQSIALALEKSGIMVTLDKDNALTPETSFSSEGSSATEDNIISQESSTGILPLDLNEASQNPQDSHAPTTAEHQDIVNLDERSATTQSVFDTASRGQKRKVQADTPARDRIPLKDNTIADRNQHNSNAAITPGTPRIEKGKQKVLPCAPNGPRISQAITPITSPTRNPFTPQQSACSTAMRAHALTTTGQESYLTLVLSSPATASPARSTTGRVTFTSPLKSKHRDCPPISDDHFGIPGASSPRYSFDFNISGSSPYLGAFDPIPLEVSSLALASANWTPPSSLGPSAPVRDSKTHRTSRASHHDTNIDEDGEGSDMELTYPDEPSSPLERVQRRRSSGESPIQENEDDDDDFDMNVFVDLKDAGPPLTLVGVSSSPPKNLSIRGFSKEFGLLSQEEVERIVGDASPTRIFEDEARSSKRRKVDATP